MKINDAFLRMDLFQKLHFDNIETNMFDHDSNNSSYFFVQRTQIKKAGFQKSVLPLKNVVFLPLKIFNYVFYIVVWPRNKHSHVVFWILSVNQKSVKKTCFQLWIGNRTQIVLLENHLLNRTVIFQKN